MAKQKMMTKKQMMISAHAIAKQIVEFTENYQIALSLALKEVWRQVKLYNKKRFGVEAIWSAAARICRPVEKKDENVDGVPAWIIRKNLGQSEAYAVLNECNGSSVIRETEKAVLVSFDTNYGVVEMWSPKSVLVA